MGKAKNVLQNKWRDMMDEFNTGNKYRPWLIKLSSESSGVNHHSPAQAKSTFFAVSFSHSNGNSIKQSCIAFHRMERLILAMFKSNVNKYIQKCIGLLPISKTRCKRQFKFHESITPTLTRQMNWLSFHQVRFYLVIKSVNCQDCFIVFAYFNFQPKKFPLRNFFPPAE